MKRTPFFELRGVRATREPVPPVQCDSQQCSAIACVVLVFAIALVSCASTSRPAPSHDVVPVNAGIAPCDANVLQLRVDRHEGLPVRAFVDVTKDGAPATFLFDTGAARTHVSHSLDDRQIRTNASTVRLGCSDRTLESWPHAAQKHSAGLDVIGVLGADAVMAWPTELDLRADRLIVRDRVPEDVARWPTVPLEVSHGVALTRARVDGRAVRLLFDTGTDTLLLLTDDPGTGTVVMTHDVFAKPIEMVWGSAQLEWDSSEARKVPAWRTRSHPAFERHARELGGADGILGIAAMGNRRLVVDAENGRLFVEP